MCKYIYISFSIRDSKVNSRMELERGVTSTITKLRFFKCYEKDFYPWNLTLFICLEKIGYEKKILKFILKPAFRVTTLNYCVGSINNFMKEL